MPRPSTSRPIIVWFRDDLRIADNPALSHAVESGRPIIPVFVLDQISHGIRPMGAASLWWLHGSLFSLQKRLKALGASLILRRGPAADVIRDLVEETGAEAVTWNRRYDPDAVAIDRHLKAELQENGIQVTSCNGSLLFEPWTLTTKAGDPFKVFTPFWRAAQAAQEPRKPLPSPKTLSGVSGIESENLSDWELEPAAPNWATGMDAFWERGEVMAAKRLAAFEDSDLKGYDVARDRPDQTGTSRLSPYLRFGEISPHHVWHSLTRRTGVDADRFRSEIGWREFNHHILFHARRLREHSFQPRFNDFPWESDAKSLRAWQRGKTGYPIVDAGMRQLWHTGWMHNRVRMLAASFLIKDLLIDWREGEAWFWDTLVDADPANNPGNWQWVAGSGADAAPFFRVFNPVRQGEKFDPNGDYVREWVPELKDMPASDIHEPWNAKPEILKKAGVTLGKSYPQPIVDHGKARDAAMAAFQTIRNSSS